MSDEERDLSYILGSEDIINEDQSNDPMTQSNIHNNNNDNNKDDGDDIDGSSSIANDEQTTIITICIDFLTAYDKLLSFDLRGNSL